MWTCHGIGCIRLQCRVTSYFQSVNHPAESRQAISAAVHIHQYACLLSQALVFQNNPNVRDAAAISLDPAKHFRPPSFEDGIAGCALENVSKPSAVAGRGLHGYTARRSCDSQCFAGCPAAVVGRPQKMGKRQHMCYCSSLFV